MSDPSAVRADVIYNGERPQVKLDEQNEDALHRVHSDPVLTTVERWEEHGWNSERHFDAALSISRADELTHLSALEALKPHRLTRSRHEALALVYFSRHGALPLGKLSERLFVHPTSVTSTVDTLERLGYVERVAHPEDRRAVLARITPKGRRAVEQSNQLIAEKHHGLSALSPSEAGELFHILRVVRDAAGDIGRGSIADPVLVAVNNWDEHGWGVGPHFGASLSLYRVEELVHLFHQVALRPHRLTRARHEALALVYFEPEGALPLGKLGERLFVHPTSVTSTVDTLERLGYVERVAHPEDRRAVLAQITPEGRRAVEQSNLMLSEGCHGLPALNSSEASNLFDILRIVRDAAGDIDRGPGDC